MNSTESINPRSRDIDLKSTAEILQIINREDRTVADAVAAVLPEAARLIDVIAEKFAEGGRLFYFGAGTSGRIGIMDATECPPTYGVPRERIIAVIAGGPEAMVKAAETAEDNRKNGMEIMSSYSPGPLDTVIGISASGRTPFVAGALEVARQNGATTAAILSNESGAITENADFILPLPTGPEVISGSTRMKAATAQKMLLNMISTTVMIKLGKVTGNFMSSMRPTNSKLRERARFIVANITGLPSEESDSLLKANNYNIRSAVDEFRAGGK